MHTRREFGKRALAALPASAVLGSAAPLFAAARPKSIFGGVQVGVIAPYSFGRDVTDAEAILKALVDLGISGVELQGGPAEAFAGAPAAPPRGPGPGGPGPGGPGQGRPQLTPEQLEQQWHDRARVSRSRGVDARGRDRQVPGLLPQRLEVRSCR